MTARELKVRRLLLVTDNESVFVEASYYFTELELPFDRTRSFTAAGVLLSHLPYAAIVVHLSRTSFDSLEALEPLAGLLRRAQGAPVILLTTSTFPAGSEAQRKGVSVYLRQDTPLADVAQAVRFLIAQETKRSFAEANVESA
jgi:DNA-binding NarL/FixJ family response regulator